MIIDRETNVGLGHDHWAQEPRSAEPGNRLSQVTADERSARLGQKPATILLTGLSGAGKTTIAYALERRLFAAGRFACVLDGQNMRRGISRDLGFSAAERSENLRRSIEVARIMNEAGLICICSFMAPDASVRAKARDVIGSDHFLEVHVHAPVELCRQRDTDGMYARADAGEIADFPGVSAPYDAPQNPDLMLATDQLTVEACVDRIISLLEQRQFIMK